MKSSINTFFYFFKPAYLLSLVCILGHVITWHAYRGTACKTNDPNPNIHYKNTVMIKEALMCFKANLFNYITQPPLTESEAVPFQVFYQ